MTSTHHPPASLGRRLASMTYESLLLVALILVMTFPFVGFTGGVVSTGSRIALQLYLVLVCGLYFVWFWRHGGQTLPMKTWRIRLRTASGSVPSTREAILRYLAALAGMLPLGLTFWWALVDRDRQFLHDRMLGTRIVHEAT
ncbi:MAG: RDD family protein [Burkholderiales bacterium]|nr:RDD family protein [Burkholderiales bacterium]